MTRPTLVMLRALGLGDFLTAVPALRGLADAFPDHRRLLAAPPALEPLAALTGAVDAVVPAAPLAPLPSALAGADLAVNLHGQGPQSHRVLLDARPKRLIAFAHPDVAESRGGPRWIQDEHEVMRWCRLLYEHGIPADRRRLDLAASPGHVGPRTDEATVVHPGAASPARRWPAERFAAVARAEAEAGRQVVVTAGPGEQRLAHTVAQAARTGHDTGSVEVVSPGDLGELAAVVAAAGRVVCGDTGVAHLATALGTPSVVIFGPTPPRYWGPPPERPAHRVLWAGLTGPANAPEPHPGLLAVSVSDVLRALADLPVDDRAAF